MLCYFKRDFSLHQIGSLLLRSPIQACGRGGGGYAPMNATAVRRESIYLYIDIYIYTQPLNTYVKHVVDIDQPADAQQCGGHGRQDQ